MNYISRCSTFTIIARDPDTGKFGIATQSEHPAASAVVPWARFNAGTVATQANVNPDHGAKALDLLEQDAGAIDALELLIESDSMFQTRQIAIVDLDGTAAAFTGKECQEWAGHFTGPGYVCLGNKIVGDEVINAMVDSFENLLNGDFGDRMLQGLSAGIEAGGNLQGMQSATLLVSHQEERYRGNSDCFLDLRVDGNVNPINELKRRYSLQKEHY